MEMLKNYEEIKEALKRLCKQEGLRFIETELKNDGICFCRFDNRIVLNSNFRRTKKEATPVSA